MPERTTTAVRVKVKNVLDKHTSSIQPGHGWDTTGQALGCARIRDLKEMRLQIYPHKALVLYMSLSCNLLEEGRDGTHPGPNNRLQVCFLCIVIMVKMNLTIIISAQLIEMDSQNVCIKL